MKIFIDPRTNIVYASYYILGLQELAGKSNVRFSMAPFKGLARKNGIEDFDQYFAFIIRLSNKTIKAVIDFRDKSHINVTALNWCNVYGKINYNQAIIRKAGFDRASVAKIIPAGTNFGIRLWNPFVSGYHFLRNYLRCGFSPGVSLPAFFQGYFWQMKRVKLTDYTVSGEIEPGYVFFISTLWKDDRNNDECNLMRAQYIRSCRSLNLQFEGGLFTENPGSANGYADIATNRFANHSEWVTKIKKSLVVFSTPAIWGCHGWKLGEFLAMGKAIISFSFQNEMPVPMKHGENIHFVANEKELREAVHKITTDKAYREKLEKGARAYYRQYTRPAAVVANMISHCTGATPSTVMKEESLGV